MRTGPNGMTEPEAGQEAGELKKQIEKLERYIGNYYQDFSKMRWDKWNYEDGCILIAAIQLYEATGNAVFRDFVLEYLDRYITEEGDIRYYNREEYQLDNVAPGRAVIFAYEQTGREKYRLAMELLMRQLDGQPRIKGGNFWHKKIYPHQVWLDGLFMAQPFYAAYDTKFGGEVRYVDITDQFALVRKHMFCPDKGLFYHGYDESRSAFWADPETGCSAGFWLRSMGWFLMALVDTMEEMNSWSYDYYRQLLDSYKEGIRGILTYRDRESGLFFQVPDRGDIPGNYTETSGSAMVAASILKACRLKVLLAEKYRETGEGILEAIIERKLTEKNGVLTLEGNCSVAGLGPDQGRRDGSIAYYLSEPVTADDKKGVAAVFMAYAQYRKLCACADMQ